GSRRITISSTSIAQRAGNCSSTCSTTSGKYRVSVLPPRLASSTSVPSRKITHRNPSHFGSYVMPSATGMSSSALASIGSTGGLIGRSTGTVLHYTRAGDDLLHEDRREDRASTPGRRTTVRVRHPYATRPRLAAPGGSVRPVRSAGRAAGPGSA